MVVDCVGRASGRSRVRVLPLGTAASAAALALLLWPAEKAQAICAPAAAAGTPSNQTVTCSLTTLNQNSPDGYGTGTQNTNTVNVTTGASVTGTNAGFNLGTDNTINLAAGASVTGGINGLLTAGGTTTLNNNNGGTVSANGNSANAIGVGQSGGTVIVNNTGTISGTTSAANGSAFGINVTDVTVTNLGGTISAATTNAGGGLAAWGIVANNITVTNNTGNITASGTNSGGSLGIFALNSLTVTANTGTVSGTDQGISIQAGATSVNVTNNVGGVIQGTGTVSAGIVIGAGPTVAVNNAGTILGNTDGINTQTNATTTIINSGTITGTTRQGIRGNVATVTNNASALITGVTGIFFRPGNGASSIFDAGTITGTGGTAIQFSTGSVGNTLTLAPSFAINGTVLGVGSDILQLGGAGSGSFNVSNIGAGQQYQGFSTFNILGGSTWTLTGSGNSVWNVQTGGVLAGNATIGGLNVASGATVTPGNLGTLGVNGNVSFAAGSFFGVNLNAAGQNDRIAATGTATLSGGTVQALAQLGNFAPSTVYTILTAGTGVSGTFAGVTSNSAFLTPSLSYTPTSVLLTMLRTATLSSQAQTPNQASVAAALDHSSLASPLVVAVLNQTGAGARQAFDALSGELYGSVQTALLNDSSLLRNELLTRLRQGAYAGAPGDLGALAFGGPELVTSEANAYARKDNFPIKAPAAAPRAVSDLTWWAQGLGAWGRVDSDGNAAALRNDTGGVISGIDARFGTALRAGLAAGYSHSSVNVDARASAAGIDSAHVGAYAGANLGPFSLRSGATYSFHAIDTTRNVVFPGFFDQTTAHFHGETSQVFGEVAHGTTLGRLAVEPFAGLAYVHVGTGGFLENGGLAALSGAATTENVGYSTLGARAASAIMLANGTALVPRASVAWQHAFGDVTPAAGVAFQSVGAAFSVAGVPIARDSALVEAGSDLRFSPNAKIGVAYSGALAAHARTNGVKGGFTWNF
jgi:outer membrane autotransporter protein